MKSLTEYIAALNNTYTFRVKVANKNPTKFMEQIKSALDAYELISINKQDGNFIRVFKRADMTPDWVCVQTKDQAEQFATAEAYGKDHEGALLTDDTLKDAPGAQELVGEKRITSMLKDLQKHSVPVAEKTAAGKTTNDVPQGTTSPVGS